MSIEPKAIVFDVNETLTGLSVNRSIEEAVDHIMRGLASILTTQT